MTLEAALIAVERLHVLFLMFGLILFASNAASTRQAEAIKAKNKKTTARVPGRRKAAKNRKVKATKPSIAKTDNARPLSDYEKRMVDAYRIGRDWPGVKTSSNIPL